MYMKQWHKNLRLTTVYDSNLIQLPKVHNPAGNITAVNNDLEVPFKIKRVYYLYDIPGGEARGAHAHKELQQLIVAASGSFDIILDDGRIKRTVHLNRPDYGLYMPAGLWRELNNFSSGAICLVLASEIYNETDYIRDYKEYIKIKYNG
jgi:dTDP-4-dehydrorhamnose 3,5-epimerase-like enzyme